MLFLLLICMVLLPQAVQCYTNHAPLAFARVSNNDKRSSTVTMHAAASEDDQSNDEDGARLAAELFKAAQDRGIQLDEEGLDEDDEEEEDADDVEEEEDEGEPNIPQGAINAFLGYETNPDVGGLAGNVSITDSELYSAVKERVLDTAGGFVDFVRKADDEDDDDDENDDTLATDEPYTPPETIPDPELTAGEVVMLVLTALSNNDNPTPNQGVQVLFGFSSPHSQIKNDNTLTPDEYADFLQDDTEYKVLLDPNSPPPKIDKADYSTDGKKAFFTARIGADAVSVNFILSTTGVADDACWLIDSMLIRPQSMRRRRRR